MPTSHDEIEAGKKNIIMKINSKKCGLNDIWNVFYRYPEWFHFEENVDYIKDVYRSFKTYDFGNTATQEMYMEAALNLMHSCAEELYRRYNLDELPSKNEKGEKTMEEKSNMLNIFDDVETLTKEEKEKIEKEIENSKKKVLEAIGAKAVEPKLKARKVIKKYNPNTKEKYSKDETKLE